MAVPIHPEDPAPDQPRTPPPVCDLLQAARYGDLEDVQSSLAQGTTVSSQDTQGRTALHMGSANGHVDVVKCLIEHGANVNMCNFEQNTPLHYAVLNAHKPVVEFLISVGANVSAVNRYDRTPVDEAISKGDLALIECKPELLPFRRNLLMKEQMETLAMTPTWKTLSIYDSLAHSLLYKIGLVYNSCRL